MNFQLVLFILGIISFPHALCAPLTSSEDLQSLTDVPPDAPIHFETADKFSDEAQTRDSLEQGIRVDSIADVQLIPEMVEEETSVPEDEAEDAMWELPKESDTTSEDKAKESEEIRKETKLDAAAFDLSAEELSALPLVFPQAVNQSSLASQLPLLNARAALSSDMRESKSVKKDLSADRPVSIDSELQTLTSGNIEFKSEHAGQESTPANVITDSTVSPIEEKLVEAVRNSLREYLEAFPVKKIKENKETDLINFIVVSLNQSFYSDRGLPVFLQEEQPEGKTDSTPVDTFLQQEPKSHNLQPEGLKIVEIHSRPDASGTSDLQDISKDIPEIPGMADSPVEMQEVDGVEFNVSSQPQVPENEPFYVLLGPFTASKGTFVPYLENYTSSDLEVVYIHPTKGIQPVPEDELTDEESQQLADAVEQGLIVQ